MSALNGYGVIWVTSHKCNYLPSDVFLNRNTMLINCIINMLAIEIKFSSSSSSNC